MLSESTVVDGVRHRIHRLWLQRHAADFEICCLSNLKYSDFKSALHYDLQGRMFQATTETFNAGTLTSRNRRHPISTAPTASVSMCTRETDTVLNLNAENWQLKTDTKYLIDANNHTGYQQVLEETVTDANGNLIKKIVYTIGLDHISQTTFVPSPPSGGEGQGEGDLTQPPPSSIWTAMAPHESSPILQERF